MTILPSDLPGPVDEPTGPTEGAAIEASQNDAPESIVVTEAPASADSIVGAPEVKAPAPAPGDGEVVVFLESPWYIKNFDSSISGCPVVSQSGTPIPAGFVDQVISIGAANGVTITKR